MIRAPHQQLITAIDTLIGGEGTLPLRLRCVAPFLVQIAPEEFADHALRRQFRELRDDLLFLGLAEPCPEGIASDLDPGAGMALASRLMVLCFNVALRDYDGEDAEW